MTRAAELNFVSRPTVSHAIKNLEAELGLDLLIHKPRTFELTPHGLSLFDRASKLLEDVNQMKSSLKLPSGNVSGFFRVGCVRSLTTELLPRALTQLRKQYPGLSVRVTIANSEVLMQYLDEGKIEMALIYSGPRKLDSLLRNVFLYRTQFVTGGSCNGSKEEAYSPA